MRIWSKYHTLECKDEVLTTVWLLVRRAGLVHSLPPSLPPHCRRLRGIAARRYFVKEMDGFGQSAKERTQKSGQDFLMIWQRKATRIGSVL